MEHPRIYTQSEMQMWDTCAYKWFQKYYMMQDLKGAIDWPLIVGTAWHKAMELLYQTKGKEQEISNIANELPADAIVNSEIEQEIEYWQEVLEATLQAYAIFFKDDFKVFKIESLEQVLSVDLEIDGEPITLAGKIDMKGVFRPGGPISLVDHKTTGQLSPALTEGWAYNFQFMLYIWLDAKVNGKKAAKEFLVNAVKKTLLRLGKGEHIKTFAARVKSAILQEPQKYFYRQTLDLSEAGLKNFESEILLPKLKRIAMLHKGSEEAILVFAKNRNTGACNDYGKQCPFFARCYRGEQSQYLTRTNKHPELCQS